MPISTTANTNTVLVIGVAPTLGASSGFVHYTFPATPPQTSGILQSDSDGTLRWVSPLGLPLGSVRNYTGALTGTTAGLTTPVTLARKGSNGGTVLVPQPQADPTGCYVEGVLRAYGSTFTDATAVKLICAILYTGGAWQAMATSYIGDLQPEIGNVHVTVDTLPGGVGSVTVSVTGEAGLTVDVDLAVYSSPASS